MGYLRIVVGRRAGQRSFVTLRGGSLVVGVKVGVVVGVVRVRVRGRVRVRVRVRVLCNRMHGLHQLGVSAGGYLCVGQARSHTHTSQKCMSP